MATSTPMVMPVSSAPWPTLGVAGRIEDVGVQDRLGPVDVFDEALDAAGEGKSSFLADALVDQADGDAVVEEGEFPQALGEDFVVEFDMAEDGVVSQEMNFGAALFGSPRPSVGETSTPSRVSRTRSTGRRARNSMKCFLPSRRMVRRRNLDRALTQDTPTPCRPPETL